MKVNSRRARVGSLPHDHELVGELVHEKSNQPPPTKVENPWAAVAMYTRTGYPKGFLATEPQVKEEERREEERREEERRKNKEKIDKSNIVQFPRPNTPGIAARDTALYKGGMDDKAARFRAVAQDQLMSVEQLQEAIDVWKATKGELTKCDNKESTTAAPRAEPTPPASSAPAVSASAEGAALDVFRNPAIEILEHENRDREPAALRPAVTSPTAAPPSETAAPSAGATAASLEWPSKKWKESTEKIRGKKHGIVKFLRREWQPFIERTGAVVTVDILKKIDTDAGEALGQYLKTHEMPSDIWIVKTRELSSKIAARPAVFERHTMR